MGRRLRALRSRAGEKWRASRLGRWWMEFRRRRAANETIYYMTPGAKRAILRRDLWNLVLTGIVVWAALASYALVGDLADTRVTAIEDGCRGDQAQNAVIRAILNVSLEQQARLEEQGIDRDGPDTGPADRLMLAERLMAPLGGLTVTEAELRRQCERRVERGAP